ncbi:MAG: AI-2E family transporter [Catonella sp.]|uniref:AI-2E family transporter n=1 Tax=Catonella sp. TaxID=2382125 RepID=UPI003FA05BA5
MNFFKDRINKKYFEISMYVIFTCIVIFLLSRFTDQLPLIAGTVGSATKWVITIIKPVIVGFIIAYLLFPMLEKLEALLRKLKPLKKKSSIRGLAVALQGIIILLGLFLIVSLLVSVITRQARAANSEDIIEGIKTYADSINNLYWDLMDRLDKLNINSAEIKSSVDTFMNNIGSYLLNLSSGLGNLANNLKDGVATAFFSLIFSIYFLLDMPKLKTYWGRVFEIILPKRVKTVIDTIIKDADRVFSGYIRGQAIDAFMVGVVVSTIFSIIGIQYAIVIGLLIGLGNLIPYMGPVVGYSSIVVVGIATSDYKSMVIAAVSLLIIQAIDGNLIYPKLLSTSVNIHPMIVIISLTVGASIGGLVGMIVAVPTGALVKVWFERLIKLAEKKNLDKEKKDSING